MTISNIISTSIVFFVFIGIVAGCKDKQKPLIYNHSNSLIVLENADDTFYDIQDGGSIQLNYKLNEDYPAKHVITAISEKLNAAGWDSSQRRLSESWA